MAPPAPGNRGRPRHVPHPAQRVARRTRPAHRAQPRQRRAQRPAPPRAPRHAGGGAHRHRDRPGMARRRAAPRGAVRGVRGGDPGAREHPDVRPRRHRLPGRRLRDPHRDRQPAGRRGEGGRHPPDLHRPRDRRPGAGRRRGRPLGERTARARGARREPHPADGGGGAGAARPDQSPLHLQLPHRDRQLRAHRPRPRPRPADGVRGLHALLLPPARRVHDARRRAPLDRALPAARAGPRPASATASR
jgi:hypothetical protein